MNPLPHRLDRTIVIRATRETVFSFFTDDARWASWWGPGSTIDPRPGGQVVIRYPGGIEVSGEVVEVKVPERLVFTYGFTSGVPIPAGSSRATIRLELDPAGTRLVFAHEFADAKVRDEHVQGWRYQLGVFANVVTGLANANAADRVDAWFAAWADHNPESVKSTLEAIALPNVAFRDKFGLIDGISDLIPHIAAAQRFMPGLVMRRKGAVRHCQGTVLADWAVVGDDGQEKMTGSNVFELSADGRIASATGLW